MKNRPSCLSIYILKRDTYFYIFHKCHLKSSSRGIDERGIYSTNKNKVVRNFDGKRMTLLKIINNVI